jgi:CRISPR-associated protein Cas6
MFWQEESDTVEKYQVPEDIFDLVFNLQGKNLEIDHAYALAQALQLHLRADTCNKIGVHGIHLAQSGNGWIRPESGSVSMPLSKRARLVIRLHRDDVDEVSQITDKRLNLAGQEITPGESSIRKLSVMKTLFSRAVCCDADQTEADFLSAVAEELKQMNIEVSKMICGKSGEIIAGNKKLFTRTLLVANLDPQQSVTLQRQGLGRDRFMGCGLFVPHKAIDPVFDIQEQV